MSAGKAYPLWLFWILALSFIWGFLVAVIGLKQIAGWSQWMQLLPYPAICWIAAGFLLRSKRSGRLFFAALHGVFGVAWIILDIWTSVEFARHFWK